MSSAMMHLDAAIAELLADRDELDRQIGILRASHAALGGRKEADRPRLSPSQDTPSDEGAPPISVRDVATRLASKTGVFTISDVMNELERVGNASKYGSVSSVLARLVRDHQLGRATGRGRYCALSSDPASPIAEGPALAGPSVGNGSAAGTAEFKDEHRGGDAYDDDAHRDRGVDDHDHDPHRGPAVGDHTSD